MSEKIKEMIEKLNEQESNRIHFNPPVIFLQLKLVESIDFDSFGNLESVTSSGPTFFYRNDEEIEKLLSARKPDFF